MNNCVGIAELLCAYADGELAESSIQVVEDHLIICENCSAILKIYREVSDSVYESNVPAPDALCIGVMNVIQSENIPVATNDNKQRKRYRFILTRYAPIAACLVVMLLVWQFWGDFWGVSDMASAPDSLFRSAYAEPPAEEALMAPMQATPAPSGAETQIAVVDADDLDDHLNEGIQPEAEQSDLFGVDNDFSATGDPRTEQEIALFMEYLENAYAEITIIGEFPAFLAGYDPQPYRAWVTWESVFEVPSTEVAALLAELENHDGVNMVEINSSSAYAVVLYSRSQ